MLTTFVIVDLSVYSIGLSNVSAPVFDLSLIKVKSKYFLE